MTFPSVAKQLVDAGLGTRPGVDALDDHGAGETGTGAIFGRKRAGDDDRISGDTAHEDFAALPVDDLGGRAEEDAYGKDGEDRKSTRLNFRHSFASRKPASV